MLCRWIFNRSEASGFGNAAVVAFLVVQALDGVLTYVGLATLSSFGEGNPIVATLMVAFGVGAGLTGAKLAAAGLGVLLHLTGVHRLVAVLAAICFAAGVVPWTALLMFVG